MRRALTWLGAQLLPSDAPIPRADVVAVLVAIPIATWVAVLRASSTLATTTVWAEDGRVFLADAVNRGVTGSLFRTYNGYTHVPARFVASVASARLSSAALILSGGSCLVVATLAGFTYLATRPHIPSRLVRGLLAGSVVLLPIAAAETLANAANLHWFFLFAALWAVLWLPANTPMAVASAIVVFLAVTSDPFPLVLAPLVLLRFSLPLRRGDKTWVPVAFALGAAIQLLGIATSTRAAPPPSYAGALRIYPLRVVLTTVSGFDFPSRLFEQLGWSTVIAAAIAAVVVLVGLFVLGDRRSLAVPVVAVGLSVTMFVLYAGMRWSDGLLPVRGEPAFHTDSRYSVAPSLLLLSAVFVLVTHLQFKPTQRAAIGALVVLLPLTWAVDFRVRTTRGAAPTWAESMRRAEIACRRGAPRVQVEVQPLSRPVPWAADLPCSAVRR